MRKVVKGTAAPQSTVQISFRLETPIANRFDRVVTVSKRSKTSILEECITEMLPKLEAQYAKLQEAKAA